MATKNAVRPSPTAQEILAALTAQVAAEQQRTYWDNLDEPIKYSGRSITLPDDPAKMPLDKAVEALQRKIDDEYQPFNVVETIDAFPHDAAVAFVKAMSKLYGWASPQTVYTFFGPEPPTMLSIKTGPRLEDVVQCPVGAFKLPGIEEQVNAVFSKDAKGNPIFVVHATVKKKDRHILLELAEETRRIVRTQSIYRGKAIRLGVSDKGELNIGNPPEYMDVTDTTESSLLFDPDIQEQINTNILVPMYATEMCRKQKIPLKRGILLEGPFGTGKSLTARMAANVAQRNGWTFVLLDKVQGLKVALEFANRYAPAVVFAEDIDRIASERDDEMNDLVNTIDGVVTKGNEVMTVLTTNFIENLNPVILRPGRLDAVISLRAPSAGTVARLIHYYAGGLLNEQTSLGEVSQALAGQIPASIRECVERAKLGMIGRGDTGLIEQDLVTAARTMINHLALLNREEKVETPAEKLAGALRQVLGLDVQLDDNGVQRISEIVECTDNTADRILAQVNEIAGSVSGSKGGVTKALTALMEQLTAFRTETQTALGSKKR